MYFISTWFFRIELETKPSDETLSRAETRVIVAVLTLSYGFTTSFGPSSTISSIVNHSGWIYSYEWIHLDKKPSDETLSRVETCVMVAVLTHTHTHPQDLGDPFERSKSRSK